MLSASWQTVNSSGHTVPNVPPPVISIPMVVGWVQRSQYNWIRAKRKRVVLCIFRAVCDRHLPSEELSSLLTATAIISTIKSDSDFRESGTECVLSSTFHQKFTNIFFDRDEGRQNVIFSLLLCCWWGLGLESPWSGNANVKSQVGITLYVLLRILIADKN